MQTPRLIISLIFVFFFYTISHCQNASINVITQNAGVVKKGNSIFFEVAVNNTDLINIIGVYKLKAQVSIADSAVQIEETGHILPTGWQVISGNKNTITISNGKDLIAPNDVRTILVAISGKANTHKPVMLSGQLSFSNGVTPGTAPGSLDGDNPADNFSTSSCMVTD